MSEEKKECCSKEGQGGCCGFKKLLGLVLIFLLVLSFGYVLGKGYCPFAGKQTCPMGTSK